VLLLGASGFIGRWVGRRLCEVGADVTLVVRDPSIAAPVLAAYSVRGSVLPANLIDGDDVRRVVDVARPWITFNLAGYGVDPLERDESTAFALNRDLVDHLCRSLRSYEDGARVVHVGSALEYGRARGDLHEDTPAVPDTLYGTSKLAGTTVFASARASGHVRGLTARLFMVYGPGEHPGRLLPTLLRARQHTARIPLTAGLQERDFSYVEDVAEGLLRLGLVTDTAPPVVNLASGRMRRVRDFVLTAARIAGIGEERLGFGDLPGRPEEMSHEPVNVERLRELTGGWSPAIEETEGIRCTLDFPHRRDAESIA
jgi:nucleoside-diphosphate-sugar epimerase